MRDVVPSLSVRLRNIATDLLVLVWILVSLYVLFVSMQPPQETMPVNMTMKLMPAEVAPASYNLNEVK